MVHTRYNYLRREVRHSIVEFYTHLAKASSSTDAEPYGIGAEESSLAELDIQIAPDEIDLSQDLDWDVFSMLDFESQGAGIEAKTDIGRQVTQDYTTDYQLFE
jgi:hypothetical protein